MLPILCKLYYGRAAFTKPYCFHFVSDHRADTKTKLQKNSYGALYRLKFLLDIQHERQSHNIEEANEWKKLKEKIIPQIQHLMLKNHKQNIDVATAEYLFKQTYIRTDESHLRQPNNIEELGLALQQIFPGTPFTITQLQDIYVRIIVMIMRKTFSGKVNDRQIEAQDVLDCCSSPGPPIASNIKLDKVPGETNLDKKLYLGGFDPTEMRLFHRQKVFAYGRRRQLQLLGYENMLETLTMKLIDAQSILRDSICREDGVIERPGPKILRNLRDSLGSITNQGFPDHPELELGEQFCLGTIWNETNQCTIWWNAFDH